MMRWLLVIGLVVSVPILIVAAIMVVVGGALHTSGRTICDWIIDLARRGETWTKKGDAP